MEEKKTGGFKEFCLSLLIIAFIVIFCVGNIFGKTYTDLDEWWNFSFAKNISEGLVPYKDFNMVQTPLLSMICGLVFKIFGAELLYMRIMAVVLITGIFFLSYLILKKVSNGGVAFVGMFLIMNILKDVLTIDYNYGVLFITLIMLYMELCRSKFLFKKLGIKYDLFIGFLAGICILTKQTTGLCVAIACIGYKVLAIRSKNDILEVLKIAGMRLVGSIIPGGLFVIYLFVNGALNDFVSYAILGTRTFSNSILYKRLFDDELYIKGIAILVPVMCIGLLLLSFRKKYNRNDLIFLGFAVPASVVMYPISDRIHLFLGSFIYLVAAIYLIYEYLYDDAIYANLSEKVRAFLYGAFNFVLAFVFLFSVYNNLNLIKINYIDVLKENELSHLSGIPEHEGLKNRILEVNDYIEEQEAEGKKVYILDAEAVIYNLTFDRYNKNYDMLLKGNLGDKGEDGIIEDIKNENNAIYLVKYSGYNWQLPLKVIEYVKENFEIVDEVSFFGVYE